MRCSRSRIAGLVDRCSDADSAAQLHSLVLRSGLLSGEDCFFAGRLAASYSRSSSLFSARKLFDEIPHPNTHLCNAVLRAYARAHQWRQALSFFAHTNSGAASSGLCRRPDGHTLSVALKACARLPALNVGRAVHGLAVKDRRSSSDVFVGSALVEMYAEFGRMRDARRVFDGIPEPDVVLWTSVVSGYQRNGDAREAAAFFSRMTIGHGVTPDSVTVISVVSALGQLGDLRAGKSCHGFFIRRELGSNLPLSNAILAFYASAGSVAHVRCLFEAIAVKDVVTWSVMIACCSRRGEPELALCVHKRMVNTGLEPNAVTSVGILQACASTLDLQQGRAIHELAVRRGFELDSSVATSLVDMYMKCSCHDRAMEIFRRIPEKDVVAWAAVIGGCVQNDLAHESLDHFKRMLLTGIGPDAVTMVKVVAAGAYMGILRQSLCLHGYLVTGGFDRKAFVGAALIDMYSKCGSLASAISVFESMAHRDVVLWSSLIAGYGSHGLGKEATAAFDRLVESSIRPNRITFISVLSACSHSGMIDEGRRIFDSMIRVHGVVPDSEHCVIMVDMLGRAGRLEEAVMVIEGMPKAAAMSHAWCALLSGCRLHHNARIGEKAARRLLELEPSHTGCHNLLSNIYASDGRWDGVAEVRDSAREKGVRKAHGCSYVVVGNEVHSFMAGERKHKQWRCVYGLLRTLEVEMREETASASCFPGFWR